MYRFINQANISITTNRTCNLRCKHCYILPHTFSDKTQISKDNYRLIFDRVQQLYDIDNNLEEVEWEVIGGETTMMPFDFWEEMLPWSLDRITEFNKQLPVPGTLNFITNLIFSDNRYIDLINKHGSHPAFALYTSWEPDTQRFGRDDKLLPQYLNTLKSINADRITLDIIMTRGVIEMGAKKILDQFIPLGVTDFSCKMLSPFGSGKAFFKENMIGFREMADFLRDIKQLKPDHITFTPDDEIGGSFCKGHSFQCNGNFYYDLSIEPDGLTHFNANQTAEEAATGLHEIRLNNDDWAEKVLLENTHESNNKLTLMHPECNQCEYLTFCNAGWYHYKTMPYSKIAPFNTHDCAGLKSYWDLKKTEFGSFIKMPEFTHTRNVRNNIREKKDKRHEFRDAAESSITNYDNYTALAKDRSIRILVDKDSHFGKSLGERLWFYDALRIPVIITQEIVKNSPDISNIIRHAVYGNFRIKPLTGEQIWRFIKSNPNSEISKLISDAQIAINNISSLPIKYDDQDSWRPGSGLILDGRNDELFRWVINNPSGFKTQAAILSDQARAYLTQLWQYINMERSLDKLNNKRDL